MHRLKDQILSAHEIICQSCGAVLDIDNSQEIRSASTINLFQEIQAGCKPVKLESYSRCHEPKFFTSLFSNTCNKLNLPRHVSINAWHIFIKLTKNQQAEQKLSKLTKIQNISKTTNMVIMSYGAIVFSLFISCRKFGISKSEIEIRNAVKLSFSIKHMPTLLRIFFVIKPIANDLGINSDDDHLDYYVNVYLKKFKQQHMLLPIKIKQQIRSIAQILPGTDESKARHSVKITLAGLGIKFV
jgi:hypothetical protein